MSTENQKSVIVFVDHHENPMDDRAWAHLGQLGFERQLVCPFRGESLGEPAPEVVGTVIYGGSQNVGEQDQYPFLKDEVRWIEACMKKNLKVLGICLGGQLVAHTLGAKVYRRTPKECEFGYYPLTPTEAGQDWLPDDFYATQAHYEEFDLPSNSIHLACSERFPHQAFQYGENVLGLQFHPEVNQQVFRRWQQAEWAMYGVPGAQDKSEQDRLMAKYDSIQGQWFHRLLGDLFQSST